MSQRKPARKHPTSITDTDGESAARATPVESPPPTEIELTSREAYELAELTKDMERCTAERNRLDQGMKWIAHAALKRHGMHATAVISDWNFHIDTNRVLLRKGEA